MYIYIYIYIILIEPYLCKSSLSLHYMIGFVPPRRPARATCSASSRVPPTRSERRQYTCICIHIYIYIYYKCIHHVILYLYIYIYIYDGNNSDNNVMINSSNNNNNINSSNNNDSGGAELLRRALDLGRIRATGRLAPPQLEDY